MERKILIVYDSLTGNTEKIAKLISGGVDEVGGEVLVIQPTMGQ